MIAPNERRRSALRKAIAGKPGATLWQFAALPEVTSDRFLFDSIWHPCQGEPVALVKRDYKAESVAESDAPMEIDSQVQQGTEAANSTDT